MRNTIIIAVAISSSPFIGVQAPVGGRLAMRMEAIQQASAAGDHSSPIARADSLVAWVPGPPSAVLTRARALAIAGRDSAAAAAVRVLQKWDPRYARRALQDSTLAGLRRI